MKPLSKRERTLNTLKLAGYHLDRTLWHNTYIENRVSWDVALEQWYRGQDLKKQGIHCGCFQCKQ